MRALQEQVLKTRSPRRITILLAMTKMKKGFGSPNPYILARVFGPQEGLRPSPGSTTLTRVYDLRGAGGTCPGYQDD